jgi:hypothetical protein
MIHIILPSNFKMHQHKIFSMNHSCGKQNFLKSHDMDVIHHNDEVTLYCDPLGLNSSFTCCECQIYVDETPCNTEIFCVRGDVNQCLRNQE